VILSFPDLTYIYFKLFLLTTDINNQLNRKNNRLIFWKSTKTALCIAFLSFFLCDSSLTFIIPSKFVKIFHKQFTLLLFKAIYSNIPMNHRYMYCTDFDSRVPSSSHFTLRVFVLHSSLSAPTSPSSLSIAAPSPTSLPLHRHCHKSFASAQRPSRHLLPAHLSFAHRQHLYTLPNLFFISLQHRLGPLTATASNISLPPTSDCTRNSTIEG